MSEVTRKDKDKLLATALERYKRGVEVEDANRKAALEAVKFRNGEQWDSAIKKAREEDPEGARPCLVVDKTNQFLRQVVNDEKQNRPSIKVRPVDDKGDPEVAEILQGLVRHIEDISGADLAYDTAYEHAADGGFGYFRILTEFSDSKSFDQDIKIKRIRNRFQVVLDDARQEPDGSDAQWGFVVEKMLRDDYKASYPGKDPCDWDAAVDAYKGWIEEDYVLVAEYFHFDKVEKTLCLWQSGRITLKDEKLDENEYIGDSIVKERKTMLKKLQWDKIVAKDVLESRELPGEHIPIIEVIGEELDIEGKSIKNGLLKRAMEPQRIHNYAASSFVESVALAPRAQWVAAEGQIEGYEELYKTANRRNISVLPYKAIVAEGQIPVPPPQRAQPAGISVGWQQTLQNSEHDISSSMGMYAETVLGTGDAQSGKQEALQQRRGDTATFHFMDNLARSVRYAGKIILDWLPTYYDTARVARIMGEDGTAKMVRLDPTQDVAVREVDFNGKMEKVYNINVGKYDVTVQTGPGFMTRRQEAAQFLTDITQSAKDPATAQVLTYLAVKNNDWAGAEEAEKMLKKLLPPGIAEPEEGEEEVPMVMTPQGPIPAPAAGQMIGQLMQQIQEMDAALKKAGDLTKIEQQVSSQASAVDTKAADLKAREELLKLREQLANASLEAADARSEAETTNVVAELKMLVNDAVNRLEGMKQQAEQVKQGEVDEAQAQKQAQSEAENQARNDAISQQQAQLLMALQQAISLLAAPRRRVPVRDETGEILEVQESIA